MRVLSYGCVGLVSLAGVLSGCMGTPSGEVSAAPTPEEQTCLAAVSQETNNGEVAVLSSEFSQAGTFVTVGVGPDRAPWQCTAYGDGTTGEVMFMGSEGAL